MNSRKKCIYNLNENTTAECRQGSRLRRGFTIVELLIVIVVIAILAAVTIVAYNGITNQAKEAGLKSDLLSAVKQLHSTKAETGSYPTSKDALKKSKATGYEYDYTASTFCITATNHTLKGIAFHATESGDIKEGACSGHLVPQEGSIANNSPIQDVTRAQCQALDTYTGSNGNAIRTLSDNRGGIERFYRIAKLADGNCWMLDNLRLGSVDGDITLSSSDSNVLDAYTLPQVKTVGANVSYDAPQIFGPVPGDDPSSESTNYGYLYNWPAASATTSRDTYPSGSPPATTSICAKGWRLPVGGFGVGELTVLNEALGGVTNLRIGTEKDSAVFDAWTAGGVFKVPMSGVASGTTGVVKTTWRGQGDYTVLWTASLHPSYPYSQLAYGVSFSGSDTSINFGINGGDNRYKGYTIRCILD